jgi:hypothetical protein
MNNHSRAESWFGIFIAVAKKSTAGKKSHRRYRFEYKIQEEGSDEIETYTMSDTEATPKKIK